MPFGTGELAMEKLSFRSERKGKFTLNLLNKAPADWTGEVVITFMMKDAGCGATVKYTLS